MIVPVPDTAVSVEVMLPATVIVPVLMLVSVVRVISPFTSIVPVTVSVLLPMSTTTLLNDIAPEFTVPPGVRNFTVLVPALTVPAVVVHEPNAIEIDIAASRMAGLTARLLHWYPDLGAGQPAGQLRPDVAIFVNGERAATTQTLATGDDVVVVFAIAGGSVDNLDSPDDFGDRRWVESQVDGFLARLERLVIIVPLPAEELETLREEMRTFSVNLRDAWAGQSGEDWVKQAFTMLKNAEGRIGQRLLDAQAEGLPASPMNEAVARQVIQSYLETRLVLRHRLPKPDGRLVLEATLAHLRTVSTLLAQPHALPDRAFAAEQRRLAPELQELMTAVERVNAAETTSLSELSELEHHVRQCLLDLTQWVIDGKVTLTGEAAGAFIK